MGSGLFDNLLNSESEISADLEIQAAEVVRENSNILIDMNTEKLKEGKTSTEDNISPSYYSDDYAQMKNDMNPRPGFGVPDLFLEGDFQERFFVEDVEMGWQIDSKNEKRNMLLSKYGEDVLGNTEQDEREFNEEYIVPELIEWTLETLNKKL